MDLRRMLAELTAAREQIEEVILVPSSASSVPGASAAHATQ